VSVQRRPVHDRVTSAAVPRSVAAAVAEASDVPDEDLVRPELVPVGAVGGHLSGSLAVFMARVPTLGSNPVA
jgi:hypothetical protein